MQQQRDRVRVRGAHVREGGRGSGGAVMVPLRTC
jgi:hypothetical protein